VDLIRPPRLVDRPDTRYLGIRVVTPFRGMLSKRDELLRELVEWLRAKQITDAGPFFLRLIVVDMAGDMEIEVGAMTPNPHAGDGRVSAGVLPAGSYVTLTYRNHAIRANTRPGGRERRPRRPDSRPRWAGGRGETPAAMRHRPARLGESQRRGARPRQRSSGRPFRMPL
jgi:hypothetical protein